MALNFLRACECHDINGSRHRRTHLRIGQRHGNAPRLDLGRKSSIFVWALELRIALAWCGKVVREEY